MTTVSLFAGDNRETLRRMIDDGVRVHSVVTDPPYGLVSIQKRFGKEGAKAARTEGNDGSFARLSGGFMGQAWDGTGIERDPEFWKLVYDILLPGGYVFAFSGSRTGHWQACAMEMVGFIMHPMHGWVTNQGFPKAHAADKAIDKAIDKMLGKTGEVLPSGDPVKRMIPVADQHRNESWIKDNGREYQPGAYVPATPEAAEWEGWAYGTQAQKPALEPIYLGQKPFDCKTGAANLLKHGVGAVNIDDCRVPTDASEISMDDGRRVDLGRSAIHEGYDRPNATMFRTGKPAVRSGPSNTEGRHPANLILDGSPEVVAMFPDSGGSGPARKLKRSAKPDQEGWGMNTTGADESDLRDAGKGSAARFYHQFPPDPILCHPKAGKVDRAGSKHPTVKPIALMQYLIRHITPPGGVVLDPFAGSGTTAEAARREGFDCILMEAHEPYLDFLRERFDLPDPDILVDDTPLLCSHFVLDSAPDADDDLLV